MPGQENFTLLCFAVPPEARLVQRWAKRRKDLGIIVTGMGSANASDAVRKAFAVHRPSSVITCGYAGGLEATLATGDPVYHSDSAALAEACRDAGAKPVRFACTPRVVITACEKASLRQATGADAVEMESHPISEFCRSEGVPCAILRVILDTAHEDLPLDFNALVDERQQLSFLKLAWELVKAPGRIPALLRLRQQTILAARRLSSTLHAVVDRL